jgi:hypothetical protein
MTQLEALLDGLLCSTDKPEIRMRRNRDGQVSVRVYAHNLTCTGSGKADSVKEAIKVAARARQKTP